MQHSGHIYRRFLTDLSSSLFSFVLPLLPTNEELTVKEEVRGLIEKLIKTIEPSTRLLSFGSSCNSFGLRNSDMDLVVLIDDPEAKLDPSHLVQMMGDLLERETNFDVKPLPKARIPILKLNLAPSPALPFGIACDIGIENRLAIENTRLLLTYATIDPARVRTLVLFLKVWAKRRRINSPYRGTLSSYGITLMVLYFLVHVKQPPVLPNLQRIAPLVPISEDQVMLDGKNIYFFDDVETLRKEWSSANFETVGELLIDFFRFFSHDFQFNNSVLSLRAGPLTKESKGWVNDIDVGGLNENARDRNRLCIEDPFDISYNVARTVTKDGLYTLRGEFMRATRILTQRPDRAVLALAELCREREDDLQHAPRSNSPAPRAMSQNRNAYNPQVMNPGAWRSQSQTPFDRLAPPPAFDGPRRGRQSEGASMPDTGHAGALDPTAQEQWLASQGMGLGGVGSGGSLGLAHSGRGRDPASRGLETPGGRYQQHPANKRSPSAYDHDNGGSGSISAPLSPHRLYAQLEMGRGPLTPVPGWSMYDPRQHVSAGIPLGAGGGGGIGGPSSSSYRSISGSAAGPGAGASASASVNAGAGGNAGAVTVPGPGPGMRSVAGSTSTSTSMYPSNPSSNINKTGGDYSQAHAPAHAHAHGLGPAQSKVGLGFGAGLGNETLAPPPPPPPPAGGFQPFSPAMPTSKLRQFNGEPGPTTFISPSTLLSPAQDTAALPANEASATSGVGGASGGEVDSLSKAFGQMGVKPAAAEDKSTSSK